MKKEVFKRRMELVKKDVAEKYSGKQFVQSRMQSDGTVGLDVNLPPDLPLYDPMVPEKYAKVNPEILRAIDEQAYFVPSEYDITVNFAGQNVEKTEQEKLAAALHNHYNMQVYDKIDDIRNNRRLGIFLLVFGIIALAAYFFLTLFADNAVFHEIVSIVGTFSVWEAVDCWLISGGHSKVELGNAMQMATIKINFSESKQNSPAAAENS